MKRILQKSSFLVMLIGTMLLTSCVVSKKTYNSLLTTYGQLQGEYGQLKGEYTDLQGLYNQAQIDLATYKTGGSALEKALAEEKARNKELREALAALQKSYDQSVNSGNVNISKLVDEINASNKYIKQLVEAKSKSDSLSVVLTNKLTRSLSKTELKDVDVQVLKGVVYISLNDNMLYKSGSYEISSAASSTLSKIAKIITDYDDYEVLVEGNTDDVPISKTNIRNNWDLSCLRASSVVQALQNEYGVDPSRLTAGGRGEYNPLEGNDTEAGRARNRRTQIIITPKLDQFLELIDQAPAED
ncbi:MAG: OmpA family protein [Bacteroidales bacterium]|nr:OmpA family protein [Bacteroidales bacterium]